MTGAARALLGTGAVVMALGVALGAVAAHASAGAAHPEAGRLLQAAVLYQMVHGLGIIACGILAREAASRWLVAASALHVVGIACFCGALWRLALTGSSLGPVAPIGGMAFIAGWIALAAFAFRAR
jgi:uncharacterized membrane protein YgdD (TMEM256/DUF423 family)